MKLSIVTTLYRSSPYLPSFLERAHKAAAARFPDHEVILVNDGCPADSLETALALQKSDPTITVIDLSRNFGHHQAQMAGLEHADGDLVFLIDCDLEEEPEWLGTFYDQLTAASADVVFGVQSRRKGDVLERVMGRMFYKLMDLLSSTRITPNATTARLMTRRFVKSVTAFKESELYLTGLCELAGYRQVAWPVTKHSKGSSSYNWSRRFALAVNALTAFSSVPLIAGFYLGLAISAVAFLTVSWYFYRAFRFGIPVPGWASLIVSIWFLGGLTIMFIGLVGIYLSKIFIEVKGRPRTIVREIFRGRR